MIVTTTSSIEDRCIVANRGIVMGETIMGANIARDLFAGITDIVGGRSGACEAESRDARETAFAGLAAEARKRGTDAAVGVDLDHEVAGGAMLMVSVSGAAVSTEPA